MSAVPIYNPQRTFYVPRFKVHLAGTPAQSAVRDIFSVTYTDADLGTRPELDSVSLSVNNWDPTARAPKYVGHPARPSEAAARAAAEAFNPGKELEASMGYGDDLALMLRGRVRDLTIDFPQSGASTVTVNVPNILSDFKKRKFSWDWRNKKDSEIAVELGRAPSGNRPGLNFSVHVDDNAKAAEHAHAVMHMRNEYPIVFLLRRARALGYDLFLREDGGRRFLYFGPSTVLAGDQVVKLTWGKSLLSFKPTFRTSNQLRQAEVLGWNRETQQEVRETMGLAEACPDLNDDLHSLIEDVGGHDVVADQPVHSSAQARDLARRRLRSRVSILVTARGSTIGTPDLRSGRMIEIDGVDYRLNGRYFVTKTTHTIDGHGYLTTFDARRVCAVRTS